VETKIFWDALHHRAFSKFVTESVLQNLKFVFQWLFKGLLVNESRGLVVKHVYFFEDFNMSIYKFVSSCIQVIRFGFCFFEQNQKRKVLSALIYFENQLFIFSISPIGILHKGLMIKIVIVVNFVILFPREQENM
jgi:hypothetical protein